MLTGFFLLNKTLFCLMKSRFVAVFIAEQQVKTGKLLINIQPYEW
jgi:hypothetical protein